MLGDSSSAPTTSMGASSMGGASSMSPSALGGMQPPGGSSGAMGNQQSFNFNQMGGIMPNSGSRHFGMRRNMLKQTQVGRYNSRPPQGLADTQGIQAMQAKLGLDLCLNSRAKAALANSKRAAKVGALSPAIAGQDTSALGMSLGVPPMNPQQPIGQPPPQQGQMPPPMPGQAPQQGMPMPQDPSMQGPGAMGGVPPDPNAQPMAGPGGAPGSMPPAPAMPEQPPMPGDIPPAVQNNGNLVSGLAAQQEGMDENDPAAASDEIAIEAAPGLESGMPKIGFSNLGLKKAQFALPEFKGDKLVKDPYIAKIDKLKKQGAITDFAHAFMTRCAEKNVSVKEAALQFAKAFGKDAHEGVAELSEAMLKAGDNKDGKFDPKFKPIDAAMDDPTYHKVHKLDPNNLDMRRHATPEYLRTGSPSKNAGFLVESDLRDRARRMSPEERDRCLKNAGLLSALSSALKLPGQVVRGFKNMQSQTIVPRPLDAVLAHRVPPQYAHLPVGSAVPGELPKAPQRAFGSVATPRGPTPQDHRQGWAGAGALGLGTAGAMGLNSLQPQEMAKAGSDMGSDAKMKKGPGRWFTVSKKADALVGMNPAACMGGTVGSAPTQAQRPAVLPIGGKPAPRPLTRPVGPAPTMLGKTAGIWDRAAQFGQKMFGGVANKANSFFRATPKVAPPHMPPPNAGALTHTPGTALVPYHPPTPAPHTGVPDFTDATFSMKPTNYHLADRAWGAAQGALTGSALEGNTFTNEQGEGGGYGKYLGGLYGAIAGSGRRGNLSGIKGLGALQRPMNQAFTGSAVGLGADLTGRAFGMQPTGLEQAGAWGGLGLGVAGNAARSHFRAASAAGAAPAGWANFARDASGGMQNMYNGGSVPFAWAGNKLKGVSNAVLGTKYQPTPLVPQGLSGVNRAMYGLGGVAAGVPLAGQALGMGAEMIRHPIQQAANEAVGHGLHQVDQWAHQRGLLGEDGRFDSHGIAGGMTGAMVDHMIQRLGMDPSQMSHADKWMLLGGGAAGGLGLATGNPLLAAGGLGAAGYGGRNGLMELLGHAARFSTGKNVNQHVQAAMTPNDTHMTGQGWQ